MTTFKKILIAGIVAMIIVISLVVALVVVSNSLDSSIKASEKNLLITERAQALFDISSKTIRATDNAEARRDRFLMYGNKIIEDFYGSQSTPVRKRFRPEDQVKYLNEIWRRYSSGEYPGTDPFLCLAYARHESEFNPYAVGKAGERGPFQFMKSTSRDMFFRFFHEEYYYGIEEDPIVGVRLWFTYYTYLYSFVHEGKLGNSADDVQWISIAYNCGAWTRGLAESLNSGRTPDEYVVEYRTGRSGKNAYVYDRRIIMYYEQYLEGWNNMTPIDG